MTHRHLDHCEAAAALAQETGALAGRRRPGHRRCPTPRATTTRRGWTRTFTPDVVLGKGDRVAGPDWALEVLPTPGHTSDHLCFALSAEKASSSPETT